MIFMSDVFEELASENAGFSNDNYKFLDMLDCPSNVVISDKRYPPTNDTLVQRHVKDNSMFVTLVNNRYKIDESYAVKLIESGAKNRAIVYLGTPVYRNGFVTIGNYLNMSERDYQIEKAKLFAIGIGVFECSVSCLDVLLDEMEKYFLLEKPVEAYPSYIKIEIIDDWRNMVASMPLIGFDKVGYLYEKYGDRPVIDVLRDLTSVEKNRTGFGRVVCDRLREWIGIPDEYNLGLVWKEDE